MLTTLCRTQKLKKVVGGERGNKLFANRQSRLKPTVAFEKGSSAFSIRTAGRGAAEGE